MARKRSKRYMLVYQAGIANVFLVDSFNLSDYGREAVRVYQGTFKLAQSVCYGLGLAGCIVRSAHCNQAGDIAREHWSSCLEDAPFESRSIRYN